MSFDLVVKGGKIVLPEKTFIADIGIKDGKIVSIKKEIKSNGAQALDAKGLLVMPGALDVHVHLQLPFCGTVSCDDFENGTKAAACGGVTTVVDFAIQKKGDSLAKAVEDRKKEADGKVAVDYSLHGGITDWNEKTRQEMNDLVKDGITSFKMFMIYRSQGWMADDGILFQGLEETAKNGAIITVHAESAYVLDLLIERYHTKEMMEKYGAYLHTLTRPCVTEYEAVRRAATWAKVTGGRLYIVHMSTSEAAQVVKEAKADGVRIWAETCPQYLLLTDDVFKNKETGHLYGTCPQIKKKHDQVGLWEGLKKGYVDVVATDTCTFNTQQKAMWQGDFTKIPFGMPGVETMVPTIYTSGVASGRIKPSRFVELVATNPAKIFGLYPQKGTIRVGSDADIMLFDTTKKVTLSYKNLQTNCDWSPFEGMKLKGYPAVTISRGKIVAKDGKFVGSVGHGRFVKRKPWGKV